MAPTSPPLQLTSARGSRGSCWNPAVQAFRAPLRFPKLLWSTETGHRTCRCQPCSTKLLCPAAMCTNPWSQGHSFSQQGTNALVAQTPLITSQISSDEPLILIFNYRRWDRAKGTCLSNKENLQHSSHAAGSFGFRWAASAPNGRFRLRLLQHGPAGDLHQLFWGDARSLFARCHCCWNMQPAIRCTCIPYVYQVLHTCGQCRGGEDHRRVRRLVLPVDHCSLALLIRDGLLQRGLCPSTPSRRD